MAETNDADRARADVHDAGATWRPRYHYTPHRNWLSDPNGLVWHDGDWHLFYQYNPHGDQWGHMSWGHAISGDLVHWREAPVAIAEDARHMIFSGSAIVAPCGPDGTPAIAAFYTGAERGAGGRQVQCVAFSHDRGQTFAPNPDNPILDEGRSDFRDPKVFWHAATNAYVMVAVLADAGMARVYRSTDLRHWTPAGDIGPFDLPGGVWECPDLIPLPIVDEGGCAWMFKVDLLHTDSAVTGSGAVVIAGQFDGHRFIPDADAHGAPRWRWVDQGRDFYAAVGWNGAPPGDDRRIWIGWMGNHRYQAMLPATQWRGAMTVPRRIDWVRDATGALGLRQRPVEELDRLCGVDRHCDAVRLVTDDVVVVERDFPRAARLRCSVAPEQGGAIVMSVASADGSRVDLRFERGAVRLDRSYCGTVPPDAADFHVPMILPLAPGEAHGIDLWFDDHSVELFADGGTAVLTAMTFLSPGPLTLSVRGEQSGGTLRDVVWSPVASANEGQGIQG